MVAVAVRRLLEIGREDSRGQLDLAGSDGIASLVAHKLTKVGGFGALLRLDLVLVLEGEEGRQVVIVVAIIIVAVIVIGIVIVIVVSVAHAVA